MVLGFSKFLREQISTNYLYFRYPSEYIIVLLPSFIGVSLKILEEPGREIGPNETIEASTLHLKEIIEFLEIAQLVSIFIISLFICYRWTNMHQNGSYKFWLTVGVKKEKFFFLTLAKFATLLYLSNLLGVILLMYMNLYSLTAQQLILLNISLFVNIFLLLAAGLFVAELLTNPEMSAILYTVSTVGLTFIFRNSTSVLAIGFKTYVNLIEFSPLSIIIATIVSAVLFLISFRLHTSAENII